MTIEVTLEGGALEEHGGIKTGGAQIAFGPLQGFYNRTPEYVCGRPSWSKAPFIHNGIEYKDQGIWWHASPGFNDKDCGRKYKVSKGIDRDYWKIGKDNQFAAIDTYDRTGYVQARTYIKYREHDSNVSTNPIKITRFFSHWPMEQS